MGATANARSRKRILDRKTYPAEWTVIHQGDTGNCAWYIESGKVSIVQDGPSGRWPLATLGPGEIFGELALIDDSPRMASAITQEPSVLVPIARHYLQERIEKADPFIAKLIRILVQNVRSVTDRQAGSLAPAQPICGGEATPVATPLDKELKGGKKA